MLSYNDIKYRGIMRTIVDIPEEDLEKLDRAANMQKVSRAELVRRAVNLYLNQEKSLKKGFDTAFGVWNNFDSGSSEYQNALRKEW